MVEFLLFIYLKCILFCLSAYWALNLFIAVVTEHALFKRYKFFDKKLVYYLLNLACSNLRLLKYNEKHWATKI